MQKPQLLTVWPSLGENILIFIMSIGMGFAFGLVGFLIDGVVLGFIGNTGGFTDQWQDLRYTQAFASIASFCTVVYFYYDFISHNKKNKKVYASQMISYNELLARRENETIENFIKECRK